MSDFSRLSEAIILGDWFRTCQECGHKQGDKKPEGPPTEAYLNRKCRKCKSMAMDFGKAPPTPGEEIF